ncbi:MAG: right-handed parallel beta-helix repeat-containing protein [Planctomycetes bacterium]|nr:right-handed parallel beta-helix repeat-containing protein [Planctomycetota bacterium]
MCIARPTAALLAIAITVAMVPAAARAATYYVDFDGGSDSNAGTNASAPFKHCPGDSAASGTAAATVLAAGDTVILKGGVVYRGTIACTRSGTAGNPITYDGNTAGTFGTGQAIVDGSEQLTGWTPCTSAADCGSNPNWQHIYWTYAPAAVTNAGTSNLYEGDQMCWMAQDPNQPDPFFMDEIDNFYPVPPANVTTTSLVDHDRLTQDDASYWDGAYVMVWTTPNVVRYRKILSFVPAEDKITFEATGEPYDDRDTLYSIYNSIHLIDQSGEYYFDETAQGNGTYKVYLWPHTTDDPNAADIRVSVRSIGFDLYGGRSYVTIQGFEIRNFSGEELHDGIGIRILSWSVPNNTIIVRDNHIRHVRHHPERGYGAVYLYNGQNCTIEDNVVEEMPVNMGFLVGGSNIVTRNNTLRKCGSQTIWYMGVTGGEISGNEVRDGRGTHANGISVYQGCSNILVHGNRVFNSNIPFTFNDSTYVTLTYNIFHAAGTSSACVSWGGVNHAYIYNNLMLDAASNVGLALYSPDGDDFVVKNNIMAGFTSSAAWDVSHNLYTGKIWDQGDLREGEILQTDVDQIFVDYDNDDFHLRAGSPAIDAGVNVGLTQDHDGNPVFTGAAPDMGAFEYGAAPPQISAWYTLADHGSQETAVQITDGQIDPRLEGVRKLRIHFTGSLDPATVTTAAVSIVGDTSGDQSALIADAQFVGDRHDRPAGDGRPRRAPGLPGG